MVGEELGWTQLSELASQCGIDRFGVCRVTNWSATRGVLEDRRSRGLSADMSFTYRNPARSTEPGRLLASPQSILVGAVAVPQADRPQRGHAAARVARYASTDAFDRLSVGLNVIKHALIEAGHRARVLADDNGLVDREAAFRAGLGWFGKNSLILIPGLGSNVVLGSVVTSAFIERSGAPIADGCGGCTRCLDGCPTGAIVEPGTVDASRCLSWLLQSPDTFPEQYRGALGDRLYGCDDCQEVCPPSRAADRRSQRHAVDGTVDVLKMLSCDDDALLERVGRWYIPDRDLNVVRRNLLIVLGNIAAPTDRATHEMLDVYSQPESPLVDYADWARRALALRAVSMGGSTTVALTTRADEDGGP